MDKSLDMSLEDIIKSKKSAGRGKGRGSAPRGRGARGASFNGGRMRGGGGGSSRPAQLGVNMRPSSSAIAKNFRRANTFPWQRDLLEEGLVAAGLPVMDSGTKLYISNLDYGVSNNDIRELFSEIGELKRYAIHFDNNGRPSGSAEVVYARRSDAFSAYKRYNNVQLDGKLMKIEIVTPNAEVPVSARINVVGGANLNAARRVMTKIGGRVMSSLPTNRSVGQRTRGGMRNRPGRAQIQGRGMGRGQSQHRGRGGGRGQGRGKKQEKSAEELDKELEFYHAEGMNVDTV